MPTFEQIETSLAIADAAYLAELADYYQEKLDGCCGDKRNLLYIMMLSQQLRGQIEADVNDDITTQLYTLLLGAISAYPGSALPVNPNAQIPGTTIIVQGSGLLPYTITTTGVSVHDDGYIDLTPFPVPANAVFTNGEVNGVGQPLQPDYVENRIIGFFGTETTDTIVLNFTYLPS